MKKQKRNEDLRISIPKEWVNFLVRLLLFAILSLLVIQTGRKWREREKETVAATVSGSPITKKELTAKVMKKFCAKEIDQLIDQKIIDLLAERNNIFVSDEEVGEEIQQIKKGYGKEKMFREDYRKRGWTMQDVREWLKEQLTMEKLILKETSRSELEDYYKAHKIEYDVEAGALTRMIFVKTEAQLHAVQQAIKQGEKFEDIAKKYSQHEESRRLGGILGWVTASNFDPEFVAQILKLPLHTPSHVVQTKNGYHVFYVEKKRSAKPSTFESARDRVERAYTMEKKIGWLQKKRKMFKIRKFLCKSNPSKGAAK